MKKVLQRDYNDLFATKLELKLLTYKKSEVFTVIKELHDRLIKT